MTNIPCRVIPSKWKLEALWIWKLWRNSKHANVLFINYILYIYIHQNCRKSWYCSHMRQWHDVMTYCKKLLKLRLPCLLVFLLFLSLFNCMFTISLWTVILHVYQKEFPMLLRPLILCHFHVHYLLLRTIKKMCVFCALATNPNILVPPGKFLLGFLDKHR